MEEEQVESNSEDSTEQDQQDSEQEEQVPVPAPKKLETLSFHDVVRKLVQNHSALDKVDLQPIHTDRKKEFIEEMNGLSTEALGCQTPPPKKVLFASKETSSLPKIPVTGGSPISEGLANSLRAFAFGPPEIFIFNSGDWIESCFAFNEPGSPQAWALKVLREGSKGLIMCVQSYFIKHLLFSRRRTRGSTDVNLLMKPDAKTQEDCLISALSDIIWKAGDKQKATLCLTQDTAIVETTEFFRGDNVTEKIRLFHFKKQDELTFNIKKYLWQFVADEKLGGVALFLYSVLLSRGFDRIKTDMEEEEPVAVLPNGCLHRCTATLMVTGRATPYLHNGIIYEGDEHTMARPKTGILLRSEIGFLLWNGTSSEETIEVGSRLKTPVFPVWLSLCQENYGVLFNPNKDLMRDYHAENRFNLLYYSANPDVESLTTLAIDTREQRLLDLYNSPPLELLIHTKWDDASVNWNGQEPYV